MNPVTFDGTTYTLRPDMLGRQAPLTVQMMVLCGEMSDPQFAVRQCAWCRDIIGIKLGIGVTHGICETCQKTMKEKK